MSENSKVFRYTAGRSDYLGLAGVLLGITVVEAAVVTAAVFWLVRSSSIRWALAAVMLLLVMVAAERLLGSLFTSHRLDSSYLRLRYGLSLRADIPRSEIREAKPVRQKIERLNASRAIHEPANRRMVACLSERGQVFLRLKRPLAVRYGLFGEALVESILVNVDDPGRLLEELGVQEVNSKEPACHADQNPTPTLRLPDEPALAGRPRTFVPRDGAPLIRLEGLTRRFGNYVAVRELSLNVYPGEIYGFLGPNGAGKTSTIKMMVGLSEPTAGRVFIAGHDVWSDPTAAKSAMGYVPDRTPLYDRLNAREYLSFVAQLRGVPEGEAGERLERFLHLLGMADRADEPVRTYSFGMKRKLGLAAAMLHKPKVLILDEPFTGLDPRSARRVKDLLFDLASEGRAVFLSIHDLATAEAVCHRVGIIHRGSMLMEGAAEELERMTGEPNLEAVFLALTEEGAEAE